MQNRPNTFLMLLALAFGVFLLANRYVIARPSPADDLKRKWEYGHLYGAAMNADKQYKSSFNTSISPAGRFEEIDSTYDGTGALNRLGADGWEVVAIIQNPGGGSQMEYLLKRPKS